MPDLLIGRHEHAQAVLKILQDMKSQYGDDYARVIKLYFEQIAERK